MAKKIKQIRYFNDVSNQNYPTIQSKNGTPPTYRNLISGSVFSNYMPILQLGIQSLPGTKFYLNGSNNPIIIGNTGIYELDLIGMSEINSLQFDAKSIDLIKQSDMAYLIVDIIYEDGGGV